MGTSMDCVYPELRRRFESATQDPRLLAVGGIAPSSTCRTHAEQVRLRELYVKGKGPLAAVPGTSPHEIGAIFGDAYCHAIDARFLAGNPPYGNIRTRPRGVARHPRWALLEDVMGDHGLARTVPSEEWHYQLAGGRPLLILPPRPEEIWMANEAQKIDDLHKSLDQLREIAETVVETRRHIDTVQHDLAERLAKVLRYLKSDDEKILAELEDLGRWDVSKEPDGR